MPQIWLSYDELAEFLGCPRPDAAGVVAARQWARRRCSDGLTRAKLPPAEADAFLRRYFFGPRQGAQTDQLVAALETVLLAARSPQPAERMARGAG
ncbi:MAG TPA: hypothetical protein VMU18_13415 [Rhodoblastus sp.]|nr:hypothetical protein [Rhodoblastus sp.]